MRFRKQVSVSVVIALYLFGLMSYSASAQEQESTATLDETLSFLQNKVKEYDLSNSNPSRGLENGHGFPRYIFSQVSGCTVQIDVAPNLDNVFLSDKTTFSLSAIDPLSISIKKVENRLPWYVINMHTSNSKELVTLTQTKTSGEKGEWKLTEVHLAITDGEVANRMAKALKHAIKLCGGKVDPF